MCSELNTSDREVCFTGRFMISPHINPHFCFYLLLCLHCSFFSIFSN